MTAPVSVAVRSATPDDLGILADAHRLGQAAVVDARGGPLDTLLLGRAEPIADSFAADLIKEESVVSVGTAAGAFVGYCVLVIRDLANGRTLGVVTDLWVHPQARGIGVGHALMSQATDTAIGRQCMGIDARALPGDRSTKNFFEGFGLVARALNVYKTLP